VQKQAPSVGRILVMVLFALSCFGLLLFLWIAFGGSTPLRAKGYQYTIPFREAGQLAQEADVRISGVSVGRVKKITANPKTGVSDVIVQVDAKYAPVTSDSRVMLRQKTLLGETYVEITPGDPQSPAVPDGGKLPVRNITPTVELDEIIQTFDPKTRAAWGVWQEELATASAGRGQDINDFFGVLPPLVDQATKLLTILNEDEDDLSRLVSNTGRTFAALSARSDQLQGLFVNTNRVFETIAARNQQLAQTFVAFPTFQRESRLLLERTAEFAETTDPVIDDLKPVAKEFGPTMAALDEFAPELSGLMEALGPAQNASVKGLPAVNTFLKEAAPFFGALSPALAQLNPLVQYLGAYPGELTSFFANVTAATNASTNQSGKLTNYTRVMGPLSPEGLAAYPTRIKSNRNTPYDFPRGLLTGLPGANVPVYNTNGCTSGPAPQLNPNTSTVLGASLTNRILKYGFGNDPANVPAPSCPQQGKTNAGNGFTQFPQVGPGANPPKPIFGQP
jgi:phospholipid/cholesterol/gamma-HCH transport system substrate-binding protein